MPYAARSTTPRSLALALLTAALGLSVAWAAGLKPAAGPAGALRLLKWRSVGPYIGGRVVAVAGVPQNPDLFYMGAVDGGVWRSSDYGVKWVNITDHTLPGSSDSIGAIAVAPSNPDILYAGTGESDIRGDMITGDGVFRSDDAGRTWKAAGLAATHTISSLVVDPHDPEVLYAASMGHVFKPNRERGVFKSTDGGKHWHKILYVNAKTGAIDLVMDPTHPRVLYAAMWQAYRTPWKLDDGGPGSGLYKSVDGGAHWSEISRNPGFAHGLLGRIGIAVAAGDSQVLYAIVQAKGGGLFRSDNGGLTWKRVNASWSLRQRAFYYMTVYADPTDADTVYVPEVDALWVSHDGGKSFSKLHTPHGDNHIVWINPTDPKILLEGNDGGATVSTDGGKTWSTEHNQPTGQFYHIALDGRFPFHIYGAQQDEGSYEGPSATPNGIIPLRAWHAVAYGESTFVAPEPGHPNVTYGAGYYSIFLRYDRSTGQFRDVSPWPDYRDGSFSAENKYRFGWTHPIFFAPGSKALYITSQYVMKSTDGGGTWQRISPDLTRNDPATEGPTGGPIDLDQTGAEMFPDISALALSPLDGQVIWAGSQDGLVHVTRDGGKHWRTVTPKALPQWAEISSIQPSHTAAGTAYLSASRYMWDDFHPYVFKTTDYGRHWRKITTGLGGRQYVFVVRQDPEDPRLLFAGTKNTVYVSLDGGARWQPLTLNLPRVQVRDIAINLREREVAVATHGRAFWVLGDLGLLEQLSRHSAPGPDTVRVYAPQTAWLTHAYGVNLHAMRRHPTAGANPPFGATVFFHIPADYHGTVPVSLSFLDAQGHLIRTFALHLKTHTPKLTAAERDNRTPRQLKTAAERKLTGITPGYDHFQWNLRYPDATQVSGFYEPAAAGGLTDSVKGPRVIPGRYTVVLDYDGRKAQRSFQVSLDPRLHPAPGALAERLALELRIHGALETLDRTLNRAISVRKHLSDAVGQGNLSAKRARPALAALDAAIGDTVQLAIHSSEGDCLRQPLLHSRLAYLAAEAGLAYHGPTSAEHAVFKELDGKAAASEKRLQAAAAEARRIL